MDAAGGEEEHVSGSDPVAGQHVSDRVLVDPLLIFIGSDPLGETAQQVRSLVRTHDVPHLSLAFHPRVGLLGKFIVRVDLNGQVALRVDEFYQQRELRAGLGKDLPADEFGTIFIHHISQAFACERAVGDGRDVARHSRDLPAFPDVMLLCLDALERGDFFSTPHHFT